MRLRWFGRALRGLPFCTQSRWWLSAACMWPSWDDIGCAWLSRDDAGGHDETTQVAGTGCVHGQDGMCAWLS